MPYALFTRSFGPGFAGTSVFIREVSTGTPATVLSSSTGGFLNDQGIATLNESGDLVVYLDSTKTWKVFIQDEEVLEPDIEVSSRFIKREEASTFTGKPGIIYVADTPPYETYIWDGSSLKRSLTPAETSTLQSSISGTFENATYDGQNRLISYQKGGILHTITYPNATTAIISNTLGFSRTVSFDNQNRVSSII